MIGSPSDRVMAALLGAGVYVGIGAIIHLLLIGNELSLTSAWTLSLLLAWPFTLAAAVGAAALTLVCVVFVVVLLVTAVSTSKN